MEGTVPSILRKSSVLPEVWCLNTIASLNLKLSQEANIVSGIETAPTPNPKKDYICHEAPNAHPVLPRLHRPRKARPPGCQPGNLRPATLIIRPLPQRPLPHPLAKQSHHPRHIPPPQRQQRKQQQQQQQQQDPLLPSPRPQERPLGAAHPGLGRHARGAGVQRPARPGQPGRPGSGGPGRGHDVRLDLVSARARP